MKLEEKLIVLRREKGLTQLQIAEKINVSRQAISKWESGNAVPSIENLKYLSELYGVSVDYLLNDDIVRTDQQEVIEGNSHEKQTEVTAKKWIVFVCLIILILAIAVLLSMNKAAGNTQNFNFDEMESESWKSIKTDEFSMTW